MWRISGRRDPFGRDDPYSGVVKRLRRARITGVDPGAELAATERLKQILLSQIEHPGREPMGTGPTGLLSNDSRGWSEMLNEQKEALDLQALLGGKAPLRVQARYDASSFPEPQVVRGLRSRNVDMENQTAMAQAQGSRPDEDDILYNWRQKQARAEMEAETEKANLATIEARMKAAEAENPALAEAKRAASVTDFGMRRGLPTVRSIAPIRPLPSHEPSQATGVERRTPPTQRGLAVVRPGAMTQIRQQAEIGRDPDFEASIKARRAEASTDPAVLAAEARYRRQIIRSPSVNAAGEPVTRVQDIDTGEVLAEIPAGPTADMRNRASRLGTAGRGVEVVKELSDRIITKIGPEQRATALVRGAEAVMGNDPEFRAYQDARTALAGNLAVAQQGSRPSDADIKAVWLPLVPDVFRDTKESAALKWRMIDTMSGTNLNLGTVQDEPTEHVTTYDINGNVISTR